MTFEACIGVVIVVNAVLMAIEAELSLQGKGLMIWNMGYESLELLFTVIYVVELGLRLLAYGNVHVTLNFQGKMCQCKIPAALTNGWVQFDAIIILSGGLTHLAELWLATETGQAQLAGHTDFAQAPLFLRTLRLFRMVRAVRLLVQFQTLYLLVRGLLNSFQMMMSTVVLMVLLLFISSMVVVEFAGSFIWPRRRWRGSAQNICRHFQEILLGWLREKRSLHLSRVVNV